MPFLQLRRTNFTQPQGRLVLDLMHPSVEGLQFLGAGAERVPFDYSGNNRNALTSTITPSNGPSGGAWGFNGSSGTITLPNGTFQHSVSSRMSSLAVVNANDYASARSIYNSAAGGNNGVQWLALGLTTPVMRITRPGFAVVANDTYALSPQQDQVLAFSWDSVGGAGQFYVDGRRTSSFTSTVTGTAPTQNAAIGQRANSEYFNGLIYCLMHWNRILSADEVKALSDAPWQIYKADPQILYFEMGATASNPDLVGSSSTVQTTSSGGAVSQSLTLNGSTGVLNFSSTGATVTGFVPNTLTGASGQLGFVSNGSSVSQSLTLTGASSTLGFTSVGGSVVGYSAANLLGSSGSLGFVSSGGTVTQSATLTSAAGTINTTSSGSVSQTVNISGSAGSIGFVSVGGSLGQSVTLAGSSGQIEWSSQYQQPDDVKMIGLVVSPAYTVQITDYGWSANMEMKFWQGRDNAVKFKMTMDGAEVLPSDVSRIGFECNYGEFDTVNHPQYFDVLPDGLMLKFGLLPIPAGKCSMRPIVYSTDHPDGIVWGSHFILTTIGSEYVTP